MVLNLIQDGKGQKGPTSFSPMASTNLKKPVQSCILFELQPFCEMTVKLFEKSKNKLTSEKSRIE